MKQQTVDMTNREFNGCKVIERSGSDKRGKAMWKVECHCGNHFITLGNSIRSNRVKSCGCTRLRKTQKMGDANKTHGETKSKLYSVWKNIKARCYRANHKSYKYYGERGIGMCKEWMESYESFRDWALENGYYEGLTIDRINVNGNYEPNNCRWATTKEQAINRRNNKLMIFEDKVLTQSEIMEITGLSKYKVGKTYQVYDEVHR